MNIGLLNDHRKTLNFLIKNSQYEKALSIANEILTTNPKDSNSYQLVGKIQCLLGNLKLSIL